MFLVREVVRERRRVFGTDCRSPTNGRLRRIELECVVGGYEFACESLEQARRLLLIRCGLARRTPFPLIQGKLPLEQETNPCAPRIVISNRSLGRVGREGWKRFHVDRLALWLEHTGQCGECVGRSGGGCKGGYYVRCSGTCVQADIISWFFATRPRPPTSLKFVFTVM